MVGGALVTTPLLQRLTDAADDGVNPPIEFGNYGDRIMFEESLIDFMRARERLRLACERGVVDDTPDDR